MNNVKIASGNALNRRELLRVLGAASAVVALPAVGEIIRAEQPRRADAAMVGRELKAQVGGQSAQLPAASDLKMIGLIGGTAWYSTVDYYRYINEAVNDAYGNNTNPPLLLYNMNNARIQELQAKGQWDEIASLFSQPLPGCGPVGHKRFCSARIRRTRYTRKLRELWTCRSSTLEMLREWPFEPMVSRRWV
jgi:hypothetical protein